MNYPACVINTTLTLVGQLFGPDPRLEHNMEHSRMGEANVQTKSVLTDDPKMIRKSVRQASRV